MARGTATVHPDRAWLDPGEPLRFTDAVKKINDAVKRGLPTRRGAYKRVAVLLFHWDNDDLGIAPLERELSRCFYNIFNHRVENYVIEAYPNRHNPTQNLSNRMVSFRATHQGDDNLLIYVYSGHAHSGGPDRHGCYMFGKRQKKPAAPQIDWLGVRLMGDYADGDALYILDTCYSTTGALEHTETELLASASMETVSTDSLVDCLTNRLINLFKRFNGEPRTVASYHSHLIGDMHLPECRLGNTPVYVAAYEKHSITLAALRRQDQGNLLGGFSHHNQAPGRVLVSFRLQGTTSLPAVQEWEKYLLSNVPAEVAAIKVEAVFGTGSQLLLLTMPTSVWDLLSEDKAINFVAHVDSNNLLESAIQASSSALALRPRGTENVRPGGSKPPR